MLVDKVTSSIHVYYIGVPSIYFILKEDLGTLYTNFVRIIGKGA